METKEILGIIAGSISIITSLIALGMTIYRSVRDNGVKKKPDVEPVDLENHKIIRELLYDVDSVIPYLWTNEENGNGHGNGKVEKKLIQMKMLMHIKFYTFATAMHQLIMLYRRQTIFVTPVKINNMFTKCVDFYDEFFLNNNGSKKLSKKFNRWHAARVQSTQEMIKELEKHPFLEYLKNDGNMVAYQEQLINMAFDIFFFAFRDTLIAAQNTLSRLNGEVEEELKDWKPIKVSDFKKFNSKIIKEIQGWVFTQ